MIYYQGNPVPVFPLFEDWESAFAMTERYGVMAFEALSTAEERLRTAPRPLRSVKFKALAMTERESGIGRYMLSKAIETPVGLPLWNMKCQLTAANLVPDFRVQCDDSSNRLFDEIKHAIVIHDCGLWETFTVFQVSQNQIEFCEPMTKQFSAGDWVCPLLIGSMKRDPAEAINDVVGSFTVNFDEQVPVEIAPVELAISGAAAQATRPFEYLLTGGQLL